MEAVAGKLDDLEPGNDRMEDFAAHDFDASRRKSFVEKQVNE